MSEVIFATPRAAYGSYVDLLTLIDLSGYQRIFIDELDPASDNTYLVTVRNGESEPGWPGARADIRLLDLEWRTGPEALPPGVREIWRGDKWQVEIAGGRYVPLGSDKRLWRKDVFSGNDQHRVAQRSRFDVAYIGYIEPYRRAHIANELRQRDVNAYIDNNCWGRDRERVLHGSRMYLHVHQLDHAPGIPILRMVVAAAYELPFITESVQDAGIFANHILSADYAHLADFTAMWARERHTQALDEKARGLHQLLCVERTFRRSIEMSL